jgi:Zn-dependent protease with chaperone function
MHLAPIFLAACVAAEGDAGSGGQRMAEYEQQLLRELETSAPRAVEEARAASEAYLAQRWQETVERYARVFALAPQFSHALRRQCTARLHLGDGAAAIELCRRAHALSAIPENKGALARALASQTGEGQRVPEANGREATALARAALAARPDDVSTAQVACEVALRLGEASLVQTCSDNLLRTAPGEIGTHYFATIAALTREQHGEARRQLALARAAGLDAEPADHLRGVIDDCEPLHLRYGRPALAVGAFWAMGLLLLLAAGIALSRLTLRSAGRMTRAAPGSHPGGSGLLRRIYGAVLALCCAYYYLSVPLVLLGVLAVGGGALYAFVSLGRVPVKLVLIVGVIVLVTAWAVLKALWVSVLRPRTEDPGARCEWGAHPRLDALLARVARRIGTRPVDAVFLTPGTEVAVFEQGSLAKQLMGRSQRCLILGIGVLEGMTKGELKAILAHEYGHLVNRDTAGGGLALAVRRSVHEMASTLARGGAATWYNPAWWFVNGFHRVFLRVSQGASRLQEILADRWAALAYGGKNFARGLRHVIERSIRFDRHAEASLKEVIEGERALANLYRYRPAAAIDDSAVASSLDQALGAEPSPYDSHPRPADRIAWVGGLEATGAPESDDGEAAWDLFTDREAVERTMTDHVRATVERNHGVAIPAELPARAQTPPTVSDAEATS